MTQTFHCDRCGGENDLSEVRKVEVGYKHERKNPNGQNLPMLQGDISVRVDWCANCVRAEILEKAVGNKAKLKYFFSWWSTDSNNKRHKNTEPVEALY